MRTPLSDAQWEFGCERLQEVADRWEVSKEKAAEILLDVQEVNVFYHWVNADLFLNCYQAQTEQQERDK